MPYALSPVAAVTPLLMSLVRAGADVPSGLGWPSATFPVAPSIAFRPGRPAVGDAGLTPEALFDLFSTARSAPAAIYYVANGGSDSNAGTSNGAAFASISKAISTANTGGVPATVFVQAGLYPRPTSFTLGNTVFPTVDMAIIAVGGRVVTGMFDQFAAPSTDATYTNAYAVGSAIGATTDRVVDLINLNRWGNYTELTYVANATICNATPGTWTNNGGVLLAHRLDGQAVTNTNTRLYRTGVGPTLRLNGAVTPNLYLGGQTAMDGFDLEGGAGVFYITPTGGQTGSSHIIVAKNSSFKYGGGVVQGAYNGVAIDSFNGLAAFFNCRADGNNSDGFNLHDDISGVAPVAFAGMLTVNCSAYDNGRLGQQSCNGLTSHDDTKLIDIAGDYRGNHGGSVRSIGAAKGLLVGTYVDNDFGDLISGGVEIPTAIQFDNTAEFWADRVQVDMPAGTYAYRLAQATAKLHRRNCPLTRQPDAGTGTFDTY